jgi:phosphoribosylaminoimidazole carboxylase
MPQWNGAPEDMHSARVGVLGGGQLGRMMAEAAHRLGVQLIVLDPAGIESPAGQVSGRAIKGSFTDPSKIAELAAVVDVITVEIEHVDAAALAEVAAKTKVQVHPAAETLTLIQDKFLQKQHLRQISGANAVPMGDFCEVSSVAALREAGARWGYPLMLKARKLAYDGRGNAVVSIAEDAEAVFAELSQEGRAQLYVERWCPFAKELAVMVVRDAAGGTQVRSVFSPNPAGTHSAGHATSEMPQAYPVVETIQHESMCHSLVAPAQASWLPLGIVAIAVLSMCILGSGS